MPRVHYVKKARKDNPAVSAGESYYWWKFRYGGKRYSRTRPRQSQLTQSAYFQTLYGLAEHVEDFAVTTTDDFEELKTAVQDGLQELHDETEEKHSNMAEYGLEYSPTGEMLQERMDGLQEGIGQLDCIDDFDDDEEDDFDEDEPVPEDYDDDDDYKSDMSDWEGRKADHELDEAQRIEDAFNGWVEESVSALTEAIDAGFV